MDKDYNYFVDINWIPINPIDIKRTRSNSGYCNKRKPEIVKAVTDKIYEINDPFLFYTDTPGNYEWVVYYLEGLRVVKFKLVSSSEFKMCIKSSKSNCYGLDKLISLKNTNISIDKIKKFSNALLADFTDPVSIIKEYNYIADLIGRNKIIYISIDDAFLPIGTCEVNFRCKTQVSFVDFFEIISIVIFDIYQINDYLRIPYNERIAKIPELKLNLDKNIKVKPSEIIPATSTENKIIIDNETFPQYLEFQNILVVQFKKKFDNETLVFSDELIDYKESKSSGRTNFSTLLYDVNMKQVCGETCDSLKLDSVKSARQNLPMNKWFFSKKKIIQAFASGKTLIVSKSSMNIYDLEYDEVDRIDGKIDDYHTIVLDEDVQLVNLPSKKIIKFVDNNYTIQDAGQKTYMFLLGPKGSGKSALVKSARKICNMSGGIFVAQIDKLVEKDVEYISDPTEDTYLKLRKEIYNNYLDQLLGQSMMQNNSIILETTKFDAAYAKWIKQYGYKIVTVIIDESYENICKNIKIRNSLKARKTSLSIEEYETFRGFAKIAEENSDEIYRIKPNHSII